MHYLFLQNWTDVTKGRLSSVLHFLHQLTSSWWAITNSVQARTCYGCADPLMTWFVELGAALASKEGWGAP
jgi:hypothetical protein